MAARRRIPGWLLLLGVVVADQGSKWLVYLFHEIEIFGFIKVTVTNNYHASFSLGLSNSASIFLGLLWLAMVIPLILLVRPRLGQLGLWLMAAGGVSNLIDRVFVGAVRDIITIDRVFFNLADVAIGGGALLVVISLLRRQYGVQSSPTHRLPK